MLTSGTPTNVSGQNSRADATAGWMPPGAAPAARFNLQTPLQGDTDQAVWGQGLCNDLNLFDFIDQLS